MSRPILYELDKSEAPPEVMCPSVESVSKSPIGEALLKHLASYKDMLHSPPPRALNANASAIPAKEDL